MNENETANILSITYPYLVILFWALVFVAIVWGIVKLVKKSKTKADK